MLTRDSLLSRARLFQRSQAEPLRWGQAVYGIACAIDLRAAEAAVKSHDPFDSNLHVGGFVTVFLNIHNKREMDNGQAHQESHR